MLYAFEELQEFVNIIAPIPPVIDTTVVIVEGEEFPTIDDKGIVVYRDEGIYVVIDGIEYQRYIYKKYYSVSYTEVLKFPRFHFIKCSTVKNYGIKDYYSASKDKVLVIDKYTKKEYPNTILKVCGNCLNEAKQNVNVPSDTEEFFKQLGIKEEEEQKTDNQETDIFGYTFDWNEKSRKYREFKNYTCEQCNIKINDNFDRRFIHVHHRNGNKKLNDFSNLECLCILCHSCSDDKHLENFQKSDMKFALETFIVKYRNYILTHNLLNFQKYKQISK